MLHQVKYGDTGVVAKLYVRTKGLKSFLIRGLGNKKAPIRPAHLQPLTLLEIVSEDTPNRELLYLKEIRIYRQTLHIHNNLARMALAFFMAEVILQCIKEIETNPEMFDFLENAILQLDTSNEQLSAYPLWFLIRLARYLGFQPLNNSSLQKPYFNLEAGTFSDIPPSKESRAFLNLEISNEFALLLNSYSSDTFHPIKLTNRKQLLQALLTYFSIHIPEFHEVKTPTVFQEIFHL